MNTTTNHLAAKVRAHRDLPGPALRRAIRQEAGLSQRDFGEALGIDRASVSRYESGQRRPRGELLTRYVELLRALQGG